jgi:DNA-binding NarL/FixJ family response regulator
MAEGEETASLGGRIEDGEGEEAYRQGRVLSFDAVADVTQALLEGFSQALPLPETSPPEHLHQHPLSTDEEAVLRLVGDGLSDKQIARTLSLGERTVRRRLTSILTKLGASNRPQAVAIALQRRLL